MRTLSLIKIFSFVLFIITFLWIIYSLYRIILWSELPDFLLYSKAVKGEVSINYPPSALIFFYPFTLLPPFWAKSAWTMLSFFSLISSFLLILKVTRKKWQMYQLAFMAALILYAFPTKFTLGMGQVNFFVLLTISLCIFFLEEERKWLAGLFLGLAISVKLTPILLFFYFLFKKEWTVVLGSLIATFSMNFIALLVFRLDFSINYFTVLLPKLFEFSGKEVYYNQAVSGFLSRLFQERLLSYVLNCLVSTGLVLTSVFIVLLKVPQGKKNLVSLEVALMIVLNLLINGFSWQHHFVLLIFPFMAVVAYYLGHKNEKKKNFWMAGLILAYFLIAINIKKPYALTFPVKSLVLSHVFLGTFCLWVILILILWKEKYEVS